VPAVRAGDIHDFNPPALTQASTASCTAFQEIRLFVVEIMLECPAVPVGVDVVVQLTVRGTSRGDRPFGNVPKNLGFGPLDSLFECAEKYWLPSLDTFRTFAGQLAL
jgi:hypothetical protein